MTVDGLSRLIHADKFAFLGFLKKLHQAIYARKEFPIQCHKQSWCLLEGRVDFYRCFYMYMRLYLRPWKLHARQEKTNSSPSVSIW